MEDEIRLLAGLPIDFEGRMISQKKIIDIIDYGIEKYYKNCFPFMLTLDYLIDDIEEIKEKNITLYEVMWFLREKINDEYILETLVNSVSYFFNTTNIELDFEKLVIRVDGEIEINKNNFDLLANKILKMTKSEKLKRNKKIEAKNERVRKYLEAKKKYLETTNKNDNELVNNFYRMMNYLIHIQSTINYDVFNLTIFQAINTFEVLNKKEKFNINLNSYFAGAKIGKKDLEHWNGK